MSSTHHSLKKFPRECRKAADRSQAARGAMEAKDKDERHLALAGWDSLSLVARRAGRESREAAAHAVMHHVHALCMFFTKIRTLPGVDVREQIVSCAPCSDTSTLRNNAWQTVNSISPTL